MEGVSSLGHNNSHFKKNWFTAFFLLKQGPTLDTPQAQPFCHKIQAKKLELLAAGRSKGQLQAATHSPQPAQDQLQLPRHQITFSTVHTRFAVYIHMTK